MNQSDASKRDDTSTELAFQRTRQAADRTLMAWMRTSTSMITFGFSIGKLFDFLAESNAAKGVLYDQGPVIVGSLLIALAILFLVAASIEYHLVLRRLGLDRGQRFRVSVAQFAATAMSLLGLVALANLLWRF